MSESLSLLEKVLSRRSIRQYTAQDIPDQVLNSILEAGRQAPSAMNLQPWHFIVVTDPPLKQQLADGRYNKFIPDCPVTIVACADTTAVDHRPTMKAAYEERALAIIDVSIAIQNMVIAAWAQGIGSCWIGDFRESHVKSVLKISDQWRVVALLTLGYPVNLPQSRPKKPLEDITSYNVFASNE
jgi:nitroreductase